LTSASFFKLKQENHIGEKGGENHLVCIKEIKNN